MKKKYYINLGFLGFEATRFHTTISYLGCIDKHVVENICIAINDYVDQRKLNQKTVDFDEKEILNGRQVLTSSVENFDQFSDLIKELNSIKQSKYSFLPHVTLHEGDLDLDKLDLVVDRIVVIEKGDDGVNEFFVKKIEFDDID